MNFIVSSPAKVILHGEHSVVYGKPALATAIGIRNYIYAKENDSMTIIVNLPNIETNFRLPLSDVKNFIQNLKDADNKSLSETNYAAFVEKCKEFSAKISIDQESSVGRKTVFSICLLICGIFSESCKEINNGFEITIKSDIECGAGLGSSAAFGVSLAASVLALARKIPDIKNLTDKNRDLISHWAFRLESIFHGNASGVDNTVCTFGKIIKFTKTNNEPFSKINLNSKINILLVNSSVKRETIKLVERVRHLKNQFPQMIDHILDAMGDLVSSVIPAYEKGDFETLQKLFQINNDLLRALGVSHKELEKIFNIATSNGFVSKITGAGGGGFALILLPEDFENCSDYLNLCRDLREEHFKFIPTTIGEEGVKFL